MDTNEKINRLEEYKSNLLQWVKDHNTKSRSYINQNMVWVRSEVMNAGCHRTMTVGPPPAIGGMVMKNIDPFSMMFSPPYGINLISSVVDFIDQTIGVFKISLEDNTPMDRKSLDPILKASFNLIHQEIRNVAYQKFTDRHYSDSVETAFKAVNMRVKAFYKSQTGEEADGSSLMKKAFSPNNPIIALDRDLSSESGRSIQQGYMEIFSGSILAGRNPKAHEIVIIDAIRAIHFLFIASLEMTRLDEANVPPLTIAIQ